MSARPVRPGPAPAAATARRVPAAAAARMVADAVLYEGYVLFPYRASATKNRYRWQWGVVVPRAQVDRGATEPAEVQCEVPVRLDGATMVTVTARFLHLRRRQVEDRDGVPQDRLQTDQELHVSWDEGVEREVQIGPLPIEALLARAQVEPFSLDGSQEQRGIDDGARVRRTVEPVAGEVEVAATAVDRRSVRLSVRLRNLTPWSQAGAHRDEILRRCLLGAHLILSVDEGRFGSVVDPEEWARAAARDCASRTVHPVLVGGQGRDDVVLAAPIILSDHPEVAAESTGQTFDALEIDELIALCVRGLSEGEKREARATDPRAAELIDRNESLPPAVLDRLHGTLRGLGPSPARATPDPDLLSPAPEARIDEEMAAFFGVGEDAIERIDVDGRQIAVGDTVRLQPRRRADAHDLFAAGRLATVEKIVRTVDGPAMLAVTLIDDPAAGLHRWYGRFSYFHLDEVEPMPQRERKP